jgi:cysteine desulfurase
MKAKIYLDFNSTHPPDVAALQVARDFYLENYANSSGLSMQSQYVNKRLEEARASIAAFCQVKPTQVIFTSCATESNNLLLREMHRRSSRRPFRVLSSPFEHPSVSECLRLLPDTTIEYLSSNSEGQLSLGEFTTADLMGYDLVTAMAVQNESGVILPVLEICQTMPEDHPPMLVDFSQALPKIATDGVGALAPAVIHELTQRGCFLTATGHKLGAGFGSGLIITPELPPTWKNTHLLAGGNQEHSWRAGSHNIESIIALAETMKSRQTHISVKNWQNTTSMFEKILEEQMTGVDGFQIVAARVPRAPGTSLLLLRGTAIDFLIMALDARGITVSTGTSCKSRSRTASPALLAMGYSELEALSVIRLSYGQDLTRPAMLNVATELRAAVQKLSAA